MVVEMLICECRITAVGGIRSVSVATINVIRVVVVSSCGVRVIEWVVMVVG